MQSLGTGPSPTRQVRIDDALWGEVEAWADENDAGASEAVRALLRAGLNSGRTAAPLRPVFKAPKAALAWMRKMLPGEPSGTLVVRAENAAAEDALASVPGRSIRRSVVIRDVSTPVRFQVIHPQHVSTLRGLLTDNLDGLVAYRLR